MRRAVGNGMRQINLLLIPSAALLMVLATPITRLVYQRGSFGPLSTHLVATALFWFAFCLPFAGVNLLLTRTFFAVQRPWIPTRLAAMNMVVDVIVSLALYKPLGIAGLVIGTASANVVMTALQLHRLRIGFNGRLEGGQTLMITVTDRRRDGPDGRGRSWPVGGPRPAARPLAGRADPVRRDRVRRGVRAVREAGAVRCGSRRRARSRAWCCSGCGGHNRTG